MRRCLLLVVALAATGFADQAQLAANVERLRAGEPGAVQQLARAGPEAAEVLFRLLGDPAAGGRALSALRRIAAQATDEQEKADLAQAFASYLSPDHALAQRRAAAELIGLVRSAAHVDELAALLDEPALFEAAARALARIPGEAARSALVNALARTRPANQTARLLGLLATRGEPTNLEVFQAAATVNNTVVQTAAANAIASLGEAGGSQTLLELVRKGSKQVRTAALRAAATLARALNQRGQRAEAARLLRGCWEESRGDEQRAVILPELARAEGERALGEVERALRAREPTLRHAAVVALKDISGRAADELIVASAPVAQDDIRLLLLAEIGRRRLASGEEVLLKAAGERDRTIALAALAALERVARPSSAAAVLAVAENARGIVRKRALSLALRLGDALLGGAKGQEALAVFAGVLPLAEDERLRRAAILGLGRTGRPETLKALEPILARDDDPQRPLALAACVAVGDAALRRGERADAAAAYRRALAAQPDLEPAIIALARLGIHPEMKTLDGTIATWWVVGPFPCNDLNNAPRKAWFPEEEIALAKSYEVEGRRLRWRLLHSDHERGWMLLRGKFRPSNRVLAYAYTTLTLAAPAHVVLAFGRDDGLTLWVNGQELYNEHGSSAIGSQEHTAEARLRAGENHILVKCSQGGGDWGFYLRVTTPDGKPLVSD